MLHSSNYYRAYCLRRGINIGFQSDIKANVFGMIGYGQSSWDAISKKSYYLNISFTAGIFSSSEINFKWGAAATGYLNHIGPLTFSPLVYGGTIQFIKDTKHGELYLRPEIGLSYPNKFKSGKTSPVQAILYVIYGYNFPVFHSQFDYGNNILSIRLLVTFRKWFGY